MNDYENDSNAWFEYYSRQIVLQQIKASGQNKINKTKILLIGSNALVKMSATILNAAGLSRIWIFTENDTHANFRGPQNLDALDIHELSELEVNDFSLIGVFTNQIEWIRKINRALFMKRCTVFGGWNFQNGIAIYGSSYPKQPFGDPCIECFEAWNQKFLANEEKDISLQWGMVSMVSTELLQWILTENSPLLEKIWITTVSQGMSFYHEIHFHEKCPVGLSLS